MRKSMAVLLVAVVLVVGFAVGVMRPAKAATEPVQSSAKSNSLVCLWVPALNVGLC